MTIRRIVPDLIADDPAGTIEFYAGVLGLEVAMDMGWIITFRSTSNPTAQINVFRQPPGTPAPDYSVEVADLDATHARACAAGALIIYPLTDEPWGVRRFFVRDPCGRIANIMCHRPPAAVPPGQT